MATETTTTFQKYVGTRPRNYCTLPTIDVPVLTPATLCRTCKEPIHYDTKAFSYRGRLGPRRRNPPPPVALWRS